MAEPDIFEIMRLRAERKNAGGNSLMPTPRREEALRAEPVSSVPPPPPPPGRVETMVQQPLQKEAGFAKPSVHGSSSQPQVSKRERSGKSRHGKETSKKKRRSSSISTDGGFVFKNFDEYHADPMEAAIQVFRHFTDLAQKPKAEAESCVQAAEKERDLAMAKLEKAQSEGKKDEAKNSDLEKEIAKLKQERNEVDNSRMLASQRVTEQEFALKVSKETKAKAAEKAADLEDQIEDLKAKLKRSEEQQGGGPDLQERIRQLEDEVAETADLGMKMGAARFAKALEQVKVLQPDFSPDLRYMDPKYNVVDGKIIFVEGGVRNII